MSTDQPQLPAELTDPITAIPVDQARERLDALLGEKVRATVAHPAGGTPRIIDGTLTTEIGLYAAEDATVRYPGSTVHVDHHHLLAVEEAPAEDTGPDAWDVSRMEHETDVLRDRIRSLEAVIEAVSCAGSLDEVGEALEQATTAPTHTHHTE